MIQYMSKQEENYWKHILNMKGVSTSFLKNQVIHGSSLTQTAAQMPVCPNCEGLMLGDNKGFRCGSCETWIPQEKAHLLKDYLQLGDFL